jgi:hypothetical protein
MYNVNPPPANQLPSSRALLRSTLIAAGTALVLLVIVVLPAEYGVDPTRLGRVLGLTQMGEIKMALAEEAAAATAAEQAAAEQAAVVSGEVTPTATETPVTEAPVTEPAATEAAGLDAPAGVNSHEVSVTLEPGQGKEIKLVMLEGDSVDYRWTVAGGVVNSDTHADRPGLDYHGYFRGTGQASDAGVLVAAFDGMHGWFWRNRGTATVTVTLQTRGVYQELRRLE